MRTMLQKPRHTAGEKAAPGPFHKAPAQAAARPESHAGTHTYGRNGLQEESGVEHPFSS